MKRDESKASSKFKMNNNEKTAHLSTKSPIQPNRKTLSSTHQSLLNFTNPRGTPMQMSSNKHTIAVSSAAKDKQYKALTKDTKYSRPKALARRVPPKDGRTTPQSVIVSKSPSRNMLTKKA